MSRRAMSIVVVVGGIASSAPGQPVASWPGDIRGITAQSESAGDIQIPEGPLVAALPYDGSSEWGSRAQDYETAFDVYDIFAMEDIELTSPANLGEFYSAGFSNTGNPFGAEDVVVRIFEDDGSGLPGQDSYTGELIMISVRGAGGWDGDSSWATDFGGQCLAPGRYYLVWAVRMDFACCGSVSVFQQSGEPSHGGGGADNAWLWNPGGGFGLGPHFRVRNIDFEPTGLNYLLFGTPGDCEPPCIFFCGDVDGDGDSDGDDFFLYLDLFAAGDECADIDGDGDIDGDDFFGYLDLFVVGC